MAAAKQGRGRPRSSAVEGAIVRAALDEFLERGAAATSIERVAARAGVTRASIYRRFPDKARLLLAAIESLHTGADAAVLEWSSVPAMIADWARYLRDHRQRLLLRRLFAATDDFPQLRRAYWRHAGQRRAAAVLATLERALRRGHFRRATDVTVVAKVLSGATLTELGAHATPRRAAAIERDLWAVLAQLGFRRRGRR